LVIRQWSRRGGGGDIDCPPGQPEGARGEASARRSISNNHERAEEERRGLVRWLRPDFQAPGEGGVPEARQQEIELAAGHTATKPAPETGKHLWPETLPEQVAAVQRLLPVLGPDAEGLAAAFGRRSQKRTGQVAEILATLEALGRV
jgi:antitoxin component HigA of HigAB toxin-antitoxin module